MVRNSLDLAALAAGEEGVINLPEAEIALDHLNGAGIKVYDGQIKITDFDKNPVRVCVSVLLFLSAAFFFRSFSLVFELASIPFNLHIVSRSISGNRNSSWSSS